MPTENKKVNGLQHEFYQGGWDNPNSFTLYLTYKCNWFCDYCSEDTHNRNEVTVEDIQRKLSEIPANSDVAITGGEPGILSKDVLKMVFDDLTAKNCFINVNTNGLFFKRHPELCDIPQSFLYHCSEHLTEDELYIPNFIPREKIDFLLVVTDETYKRLDYYIEKYPNIKFLLFGADRVQYDNHRAGKGLSRTNGFKVYTKYKDRIHPDSYIHLITSCWEVNNIRKLQALR
jgi:organic radical activating enzyme